jgi:WD40 repeat protein
LGTIKELKGHTGIINCFATTDTDILLSGSADNTIKVWDCNQNFCLIKSIEKAHDKAVDIIVSFTRGYFASSGQDLKMKVWSIFKYECINVIELPMFLTKGLVLSGLRLITISFGNKIMVWE